MTKKNRHPAVNKALVNKAVNRHPAVTCCVTLTLPSPVTKLAQQNTAKRQQENRPLKLRTADR
ncbi:MAG: hypothetical protein U1C60_09350 [Rhodocyclaceae bacterium]|nr:hypothetical protein [Rhodocyclaceae bacterium]